MAPQIWKFIHLRGRNEGQQRPRAQGAPHLSPSTGLLLHHLHLGSYFYFTTRSKPSPNSVSASCPTKDSKLTRHVRYHSQCFSPITWYENIATRFCKDNILGVRTDFYLIYSGPLCPLIKIIKTKPLLVLHYAGSRCGGPNIAA